MRLLLKIAVPALTLSAFMNCSPAGFGGFRTSRAKADSGKTFAQMSSEYDGTIPVNPNPNPNPTPVPSPTPTTPVNTTPPIETHQLFVDPGSVQRCEAGEIDIIDGAFACQTPGTLLLTILDESKEAVALRIPFGARLTPAQVAAQIEPALQATIVGHTAHIFLCIDANNNGKCTDEPIVDLNPLSATVAWHLMAFGNLQYLPDYGQGGAGIIDRDVFGVCAQLKKGLVLFHRLYDFKTGGYSDQALADRVQGILKNLDQPTSVNGTPSIPIPLGVANRVLCPVSTRTDGCFIEGTRIAMTPDHSVAVEKLVAGYPVMLADGRTSKITRVVAGPEAKPVITFEMGAGSQIAVTAEHPLVTNKGLRLAKDIQFGEELLGTDGGYITIVGIKQSAYKGLVYNFELEGNDQIKNHLVVAEKVISGDLYLQNKMSKEAAAVESLLSAK